MNTWVVSSRCLGCSRRNKDRDPRHICQGRISESHVAVLLGQLAHYFQTGRGPTTLLPVERATFTRRGLGDLMSSHVATRQDDAGGGSHLAPWLLLLLLLVIAVALRFWRLGLWNFEATEMFTLRDSVRPQWHNPRPLGYLLTYYLVRPFHPLNEFGLRFLPAVFGVLAVPALYVVAWRLAGTRAALFTALLIDGEPAAGVLLPVRPLLVARLPALRHFPFRALRGRPRAQPRRARPRCGHDGPGRARTPRVGAAPGRSRALAALDLCAARAPARRLATAGDAVGPACRGRRPRSHRGPDGSDPPELDFHARPEPRDGSVPPAHQAGERTQAGASAAGLSRRPDAFRSPSSAPPAST